MATSFGGLSIAAASRVHPFL